MQRILSISSEMGGALPFLIPSFAGLSATGALAGGAVRKTKAINEARATWEQLKRVSVTMELLKL